MSLPPRPEMDSMPPQEILNKPMLYEDDEVGHHPLAQETTDIMPEEDDDPQEDDDYDLEQHILGDDDDEVEMDEHVRAYENLPDLEETLTHLSHSCRNLTESICAAAASSAKSINELTEFSVRISIIPSYCDS